MTTPNLISNNSFADLARTQGNIWGNVINNVGASVTEAFQMYIQSKEAENDPKNKLAKMQLEEVEKSSENLEKMKDKLTDRAYQVYLENRDLEFGTDLATENAVKKIGKSEIDQSTQSGQQTLEPVNRSNVGLDVTQEPNTEATIPNDQISRTPPVINPEPSIGPVNQQQGQLEPVNQSRSMIEPVTPEPATGLQPEPTQTSINEEQVQEEPSNLKAKMKLTESAEKWKIKFRKQLDEMDLDPNKITQMYGNLETLNTANFANKLGMGLKSYQFNMSPMDLTNEAANQQIVRSSEWMQKEGAGYIDEIIKEYKAHIKQEPSDLAGSEEHFEDWAYQNYGVKVKGLPDNQELGIKNKLMLGILSKRKGMEPFREQINSALGLAQKEQQRAFELKEEKRLAEAKRKEKELEDKLGEKIYQERKDLVAQRESLLSKISTNRRFLAGENLTEVALASPEATAERKTLKENIKVQQQTYDMYDMAIGIMEEGGNVNQKEAIKIARKFMNEEFLDFDERAKIISAKPNTKFTENHTQKTTGGQSSVNQTQDPFDPLNLTSTPTSKPKASDFRN